MITVKNKFPSPDAAREFVHSSERAFEERLSDVCRGVAASETRIITLSGPTCSGKSTAAHKLTSALTASGHSVRSVSIDNFFRERGELDREAIMKGHPVDYDSVNAIDLELLAERCASIISGRPTELPVYDFVLGRAEKSVRVVPDDSTVFIFEGIQAIYPEVTALFGDSYRSVHISVEDDVSVGDVYFCSREIRLMRRLVRDYKFRGASPEFTFFLWRSVTANEDRSILPFAHTADLTINSLLPYEIGLMSGILPTILSEVSEDSVYFPKAYDIISKLSTVEPISADAVPTSSLLREFIGQ